MSTIKLYYSVVDTVGNTPLVRLNHLTKNLKAEIYLKCEFRNPLFSVKDRVGKAMIEAAEASGELQPGGLIIEPTSGNTGIALAFIARAKGYRCLLVMPETMSVERRTLLRLLGAEIVLTPGVYGMKGAIAKAQELLEEYKGKAFGPAQFDNPVNPLIHYKTTGPEILQATGGKLDIFVASVGTGGTFSGTTRYLKEHLPSIKAVAVEPSASPVLSGGAPGSHVIQGIGAGFIPKNMDMSLVDEIVQVSNEATVETARALAQQEGIPAGLSTGATTYAALELAARAENAGKRIIVIAPSSTERYLSTILAEAVRAEVAELPVSDVRFPG